jgi:hypothetical protein
MAKAVVEAKSEGPAANVASVIPSPALAVPATLHASLMARLDRLGPAKELAQIGAAIGREFSHSLLAAVVKKPEAELQLALGRLIAAGLLFRQGMPPNASYLFKHCLTRTPQTQALTQRVLRGLCDKAIPEHAAPRQNAGYERSSLAEAEVFRRQAR